MRKTRILMIEDERDVLANNREFLEGEGYEIHTAATIAEARLQLEEAPDLILLDVMLPDGLGWDFAEEIRERTKAPILYLTCRNENESVVKGLDSGGDDYIVKPYDMNVLAARIRAALRRAGTEDGTISVPPLSVDILSGTAELAGEKISLSPRELQLLACLARSAGRCVSCEEIYRRVWGDPVSGYERTISVYITYLRRKLRLAENGLFEIRAVAGREYILSKTAY